MKEANVNLAVAIARLGSFVAKFGAAQANPMTHPTQMVRAQSAVLGAGAATASALLYAQEAHYCGESRNPERFHPHYLSFYHLPNTKTFMLVHRDGDDPLIPLGGNDDIDWGKVKAAGFPLPTVDDYVRFLEDLPELLKFLFQQC